MDGQRRQGFLKQVYLMAAIGLIVTSIFTYAVQRSISESNVERSFQQSAANISDETIDAVTEYPAYRWLLRYWYEHGDEMNIEYDVDFRGETVTEQKCIQFARNNPGIQLEYLTTYEIGRLSAEDQKLYAEIVYTWMTNRINQIKRNYGVDFLYVVMTPTVSSEKPYQSQFFVLSGSDSYAPRSSEYGEFYVLGTFVEVDESLQNAMRTAVENARPSRQDGARKEQAVTYLGTGSEFADYYAYIDQINDQAVLVGITYNLAGIRESINMEAVQRTAIAIAFQLVLLAIVLYRLHVYMLSPLKDVIGNIRMYASTKDSDTVTNNLTEILAGKHARSIKRNEIGELSEDIINLAREVDDYVSEIETITTERERIGAELNLAANIQANMLPNIFPPFPNREEFDIFASMDPAKEVGGDFYDYFMVDDDHLALAIADVSGKGIPAALFMMASMILIESVTKRVGRPAESLAEANKAICSNNQENMFVTVWLGVLEISTGKLVAVNAGHECPAVRHANGDFEILQDKHGLMVGAFEFARYTEYEIQLEPGSKVFVYSDGAPDATNANGERFKIERLARALRNGQDGSPREILDTVRDAINEFTGDAEQFDDLTMLCLEYKGC